MAAPKGNKFWKLRSKHGRDKLFASSELLWTAACEYFQWCDNTPWVKVEQRKGNVIIPKGISSDDLKSLAEMLSPVVTIPTARPYTLEGLCNYLGCNTGYFRTFKRQVKDTDQDFSAVITRIEETIYQQKFEGAAIGAFNANIIARDLGLIDRKEVALPPEEKKIDYSKLSDGALEEIARLADQSSRSDSGAV